MPATTPMTLLRTRVSGLVTVLALVLMGAAATPAFAAVTVSRAEVSGSTLRLEGTATAARDITVDGTIVGRSDSGGKFKFSLSAYTAPADCTIDVNDGSATPRVATLSGCTVSSAPPPPPPASSGPAAPSPSAPADGASVTVPTTLSWSAVTHPSGILGYNWEVSSSPSFSPVVTKNSTNPDVTQDTVGVLAAGTYYWRVQAVNGALVQGAWSATRSFVVTGPGAGALGAPVLDPLPFGNAQYHPMESFPFTWSAVPGASSYVVEASRDATFPDPPEIKFDNIPKTSYGLTMHQTLIGNWNLRVYAVDANGVAGARSNVRTFSISYDAPIGPPPTLASPADGATLDLPIKLDWNDVENPQDLGYEIQVSSDPGFSTLDIQGPTTPSEYNVLSLPAGKKYWRVRSTEGDASPTTAAMTAFSAVRSFTVSDAAPKVASIDLGRPSVFSGMSGNGRIQLSGPAPPGGAVVALSSSHPGATGLPATVTVDAGFAFAQFNFTYGQVTEPAAATVTATYAGSSATFPITVDPPSLKEILPSPNSITGGSPAPLSIAFNGSVPAGGATIALSSSSALVETPASVDAAAGSFFHQFTVPTKAVTTTTPVTITATWKGQSITQTLTLTPGVPPDVWTVEQLETTGSGGSTARVAIAEIQTKDTTFNLTSSNPDIAFMSPVVTIPAGSPHAGVLIQTRNPATTTTVTLSVSGGGVTKTATLTVKPMPTAPPPPLAAPTLVAPANSARVAPGQSVTFDWSDVANAASYTLQVSSSSAFTTTVLDRTVTASQVAAALTATGDRFWRVRANRADGSAGTWSAVRSFRVK
ncbi:MAG: hypothetical protein QOD44_2048 [Solirubrobacteraceae bacterium]|nr:hypothetical protein [Solirubrobacteraceae bacterium]